MKERYSSGLRPAADLARAILAPLKPEMRAVAVPGFRTLIPTSAAFPPPPGLLTMVDVVVILAGNGMWPTGVNETSSCIG